MNIIVRNYLLITCQKISFKKYPSEFPQAQGGILKLFVYSTNCPTLREIQLIIICDREKHLTPTFVNLEQSMFVCSAYKKNYIIFELVAFTFSVN